MLRAALAVLKEQGIAVQSASKLITSLPLGPSRRRYANGAAVVKTDLLPDELLDCLQRVEAHFGQRRGQRWGARVLDLDIVLWSGGAWGSPRLIIPHPAFRRRSFVITPAAAIAARWRDPISGLTLRQLAARQARRLTRPTPPRKRAPAW